MEQVKKFCRINVLVLLFIATRFASNGQSDSLGNKPEHLEVKLTTQGHFFSGVFNQFAVNNKLDLAARFRKLHATNISSYRFNETSGHVIENDWLNLLTLSYRTEKSRLFPQLLCFFENNRLFKLSSRQVYGIGMSSIFRKQGKGNFWQMTIGLGYETSIYDGEIFTNTKLNGRRQSKPLIAARVIHKHYLINEKITLSSLVLSRQSVLHLQDFFVLFQTKLSYHLNRRFSLHTSMNLRYENIYLKGISNLNSAIFFGCQIVLDRKKVKG